MTGSYVQVASVAKFDPKSSLIKKLNSLGYKYKTYETTVNGKKVIKLLIGPFSDAELKQKLGQIKADIDQKAYIYKIK
ncbi:MAG: SPOR domain-containing protein [Campylobacter sp.]|nr:SPOR domain-containing protein [Campylobacter sp.]MCI7463264.1 SPOR domain-containing protein [Campylobacter sp.]